MSENYSYEKILPIAPLKIVALEGCRDLAKEVDKYLVDFVKKENPGIPGYTKLSWLSRRNLSVKKLLPAFWKR